MEKRNGRAVTVILYDARKNPPEESGEYLYVETLRDNGALSYAGKIPYSAKYGRWNTRDSHGPEDATQYAFETRDDTDAFWVDFSEIKQGDKNERKK